MKQIKRCLRELDALDEAEISYVDVDGAKHLVERSACRLQFHETFVDKLELYKHCTLPEAMEKFHAAINQSYQQLDELIKCSDNRLTEVLTVIWSNLMTLCETVQSTVVKFIRDVVPGFRSNVYEHKVHPAIPGKIDYDKLSFKQFRIIQRALFKYWIGKPELNGKFMPGLSFIILRNCYEKNIAFFLPRRKITIEIDKKNAQADQ